MNLELREEQLDSIATWIVPYKQPPTDQQRAVSLMDGGSKVNGKHPIQKATTLIEEGKSKSAQWDELHGLFLAVMKQLNNDKSPYVLVFIDSWVMTNGLALWSGKREVDTWSTKGVLLQDTALWKSLWEFEGCIKVGHVDAHQKNPLPSSEGNWKHQIDFLVHSTEVVHSTRIHELSRHGGGDCSNAEIG